MEIKIVNKLYDKLQQQMVINKEGTYKYYEAVEDEDDRYPKPPDSPVEVSDEELSGTDPET
jgi:hypothetical protein